jgi:L-fuculose-phosphate aldolase
MTAAAAARRMAACCRRLAERGLIAGVDGNLSVRLARGRVLVTPSGRHKADLRPGDMVEVDAAGRRRRGRLKPTSELDLHLTILAARADVGAVVHAHPPVATGFAVAGEGLDALVLPELLVLCGPVPLVPYGEPGTPELGRLVGPVIAAHDAVLLANHGAVTVGPTLDVAWQRMESLEHAARILLAARQVGRVTPLPPAAADRLLARRGGKERDVH